MEIIKDIQNAFLPELIIVIFIVLNIILALFIRKNAYKTAKIITSTGLVFAGIAMFFVQLIPEYYAFNGVYLSNIFTCTFKIMLLICAFFAVFISGNLTGLRKQKSFEFFSLLLSGILSGFSFVSSNDFITAFISIEILSISCYFLTGFNTNRKSKEAALKYLITGAASSAIFLLGVSYLYGITGSISLSEISNIYANSTINPLFFIACLLILLSLMFKIGCIPFNNWIIDVYEGAAYNICAYLSLIPKISAFAFIINVFICIFSFSPVLKIISAFIALYTIIYGALGAIKQSNIKRLYAYSSIIHSGFILFGISILTVYSVSASIFYIFTYIFMNIGIWTASIIYNRDYKTDEIEDYKGLFSKRPYFTTALTICLISLAGLPPASGFLAKIYLFSSAFRSDFIFMTLMFAAMLATVVSIFVYFKIIKVLYEKPSNEITITKQGIFPGIILYVCALITLLIGIYPNILIKICQIVSYYI